MEMIKGFKAFDKNMQCMGFQYKEGEVYEMDGKPILCQNGFHFCKDLVLTLAYYPAANINDNFYAEVEILGEVEYEQPTKHKGVTNKIKILRIIPKEEVSAMVDGKNNTGEQNSGHSNSGDRNSGDWNSGDWNSGDSNSGDRNSGDWNSGHRNSGYSNSGHRNSGHRNSGDRNSGDWNSCNYETGAFNSEQSEIIRVFNKDCKKSDWDNAYKPSFLYFKPDKEIGYKESFKKSWSESDEGEREKVRDLPNFDAEVFYDISGIDLR